MTLSNTIKHHIKSWGSSYWSVSEDSYHELIADSNGEVEYTHKNAVKKVKARNKTDGWRQIDDTNIDVSARTITVTGQTEGDEIHIVFQERREAFLKSRSNDRITGWTLRPSINRNSAEFIFANDTVPEPGSVMIKDNPLNTEYGHVLTNVRPKESNINTEFYEGAGYNLYNNTIEIICTCDGDNISLELEKIKPDNVRSADVEEQSIPGKEGSVLQDMGSEAEVIEMYALIGRFNLINNVEAGITENVIEVLNLGIKNTKIIDGTEYYIDIEEIISYGANDLRLAKITLKAE